jgi:HSP20 family protein
MARQKTENWLWEEACDLLDRAIRIQRQFFQLGRPSSHAASWEPPVDMFEHDRDLWILAALPGVTADRLEVVIDDAGLLVRGERELPSECKNGAFVHHLEIPHGRFERRLLLPAGRYQIRRRELVQGCLVLVLRRS